jgi:ABC-type nickel/cobalt efflux system permease component RcnA
VDHVVDMAELPAFQTKTTEIDRDHNGTLSAAERTTFATTACDQVATTVRLQVGGKPATMAVVSARISFPPGAGGLDTLRMECELRAKSPVTQRTAISYRDNTYAGRIGWREVTAIGDGVTLHSSDVPETSRSRRLTSYPADLLSSPPDVRAATLTAVPGGPRAGAIEQVEPLIASGRGVDRLTRAFTDLVGRPQLSLAFGILAVVISVVLGAAHAIAPGHGKTVMAAYLVGEKGSLRQAGVIAMTVTVTHTAGVLVLGIVLTTSVVLAPQRIYAWLGLASGLLLAGVGGTLLRRAWQNRQAMARAHGHSHGHDHPDHGRHDHADAHADHDHPDRGHSHDQADQADHADADHDHGHGHDHSHGHSHGHGHHHHHLPTSLGIRSLIAMGFAGGLVPSPSALVVLLGAVALGRTWFGMLLVLGYGAGMACTLTGVGFALARWRAVFERRGTGRVSMLLRRTVPVATAGLIVLVGLGLAGQAAVALGA